MIFLLTIVKEITRPKKEIMKKFLRIFLVMTCALHLNSFAAECLSIKSDKERLECYDKGSKETVNDARREFNAAGIKLINLAQANLAIKTLAWINFMNSPKSTKGMVEGDESREAEVSNLFNSLMAMPGKSSELDSKFKDYYIAWKSSYSAVGAVNTGSPRAFESRSMSIMNRMEAMAERLKLDLQ